MKINNKLWYLPMLHQFLYVMIYGLLRDGGVDESKRLYSNNGYYRRMNIFIIGIIIY